MDRLAIDVRPRAKTWAHVNFEKCLGLCLAHYVALNYVDLMETTGSRTQINPNLVLTVTSMPFLFFNFLFI